MGYAWRDRLLKKLLQKLSPMATKENRCQRAIIVFRYGSRGDARHGSTNRDRIDLHRIDVHQS
jgi:hypothetical protein